MLGGFGRDWLGFEILKEIRFDFLKIDGSVVLTVQRSEASLAKVRTITRMARVVGIHTIAEQVESGGSSLSRASSKWITRREPPFPARRR